MPWSEQVDLPTPWSEQVDSKNSGAPMAATHAKSTLSGHRCPVPCWPEQVDKIMPRRSPIVWAVKLTGVSGSTEDHVPRWLGWEVDTSEVKDKDARDDESNISSQSMMGHGYS
ncbi:hypothetical protein FPOAC1_006520 [Fusarium poae]|uniref:hypothetical protein n=1 Tax=Fusarium poae TaxID=36050 RepID=UPI001CEBF14E|nr:hypothetical protein FPOAC1_006520 [Fusarium poae]KAG8673213.1 hypothetical protein FPOAC1_006520 [Fusarium poae]